MDTTAKGQGKQFWALIIQDNFEDGKRLFKRLFKRMLNLMEELDCFPNETSQLAEALDSFFVQLNIIKEELSEYD